MKKIKLVQEFREFISKGNVVDMAVGVVVGGAFGKIVTSLVSDLIMPLVGLITGGGSPKDTYDKELVKEVAAKTGFDPAVMTTPALAAEAGFATLNYGNFIQTVLDFLIIALAIFLVIKLMATAKAKLVHEKEEEPAPATTKTCPFCCTDIPVDAGRCPHCTSELGGEEASEKGSSSPYLPSRVSRPPYPANDFIKSLTQYSPSICPGNFFALLRYQKPTISPPFSA